MEDKELYRHVLGLEKPWLVDRAQLDMRREQADVWTVHDEGQRWPYPECGIDLAVYDHPPERAWHHLDTCQFKTFLHARIPRVKSTFRKPRSCPKNGERVMQQKEENLLHIRP
jgi:transposase